MNLTDLKDSTVVADTSSLLIDGIGLLNVLPACRLVIPAIVFNELESKRTDSRVGVFARQWMNLLEELRSEHGNDLRNGILVKDVLVSIEPNHTNQSSLPRHLANGSNDSTVLAVAYNLASDQEREKSPVVLLSNDTPMRIYATLDLNIDALEFSASQVKHFQPFNGIVDVKFSEDEWLELVKTNANYVEEAMSHVDKQDTPPNCIIRVSIPWESKEITRFALIDHEPAEYIERKVKSLGISGRNFEQDVAMSYLLDDYDSLPIVSIGGKAGTGKTLITLACGLAGVEQGRYRKVIVLRSLHEVGVGQDLGYLPGDLTEKMSPWRGAIDDAIEQIALKTKGRKQSRNANDASTMDSKQEDYFNRLSRMIDLEPITFMRGRNISGCFVVLDEAQNFSKNELLTLMSRVGEGSKIVLLHDAYQVDNKYLKSGKNADILSLVDDLKNSPMFAHISLQDTERSKVAELAADLLTSQTLNH